MYVPEYRAFQEGTPDSERWELIAGVPVLVPPQTILHGRMVTDLANALDASLRGAGDGMMALQRIAVDLASTDAVEAHLGVAGRCVPSPDVAVIDSANEPDAWLAPRAYLIEEVVGDGHDQRPVGGGTWLDAKIACYQAHEPCCAIVIMEQDRAKVTLHLRDQACWSTRTLWPGDDLTVPALRMTIPVATLQGWRPTRVQGGSPDLSDMAWAILRLWAGALKRVSTRLSTSPCR